MDSVYRAYYAHWLFLTDDHWDSIKMALDDMWCEGLLANRAY